MTCELYFNKVVKKCWSPKVHLFSKAVSLLSSFTYAQILFYTFGRKENCPLNHPHLDMLNESQWLLIIKMSPGEILVPSGPWQRGPHLDSTPHKETCKQECPQTHILLPSPLIHSTNLLILFFLGSFFFVMLIFKIKQITEVYQEKISRSPIINHFGIFFQFLRKFMQLFF